MPKIALTFYFVACIALSAALGVCSENAYPSKEDRQASPGNTTYYIDPADGSDSNSGLKDTLAWRSFTPVNRLLLCSGDRVKIVSPGSFDQTLMLMGAGTAEAPVEGSGTGTEGSGTGVERGQATIFASSCVLSVWV